MVRFRARHLSRILFFLYTLNLAFNHRKQRLRTGAMGQQNPPSGGSRKISFNVSDQYEIQDVIGEGAYGVVW